MGYFKKMMAVTLSSVMCVTGISACGSRKPDASADKNGSAEGTVTGQSTKETEKSKAAEGENQAGKWNYDVSKLGDLGGLTLPLSDEPVTLEWIVISDKTDLSSKFFAQEFKKITNVELKITEVLNTAGDERMATLIASRKLPDLISCRITEEQANTIGPQGALAAVNDYLEIMPNLTRWLEADEFDYYLKKYAASDGKTYIMKPFKTNRDVNHMMMYRRDIFDANGIEMWNSPDEFYQVLKKLKELYPNSTPFTYKTNKSYFKDFGNSWGLNGYDMYYNEEEKLWKLSTTDPLFKDLLDLTKKCYDEGLYDPEFLTLSIDSWTTKMAQADQAFVTWDWVDRMNILKAQAEGSVPEYDLRVANPVGPTGKTFHMELDTGYAVAVSNGPNAELAMKVVDFFYSPAGAQLQSMGIEGVTYTINAETGKADYIGFAEGTTIGINELEEKYGLMNGAMYRTLDRRSNYFTFTEQTQEAQDKMVGEDRILPLDPQLSFQEGEKDRKTELTSELTKKGEEFAFQYVLSGAGADTDKMWQDWLKTAESYGEEELTALYNRRQKEMYGE